MMLFRFCVFSELYLVTCVFQGIYPSHLSYQIYWHKIVMFSQQAFNNTVCRDVAPLVSGPGNLCFSMFIFMLSSKSINFIVFHKEPSFAFIVFLFFTNKSVWYGNVHHLIFYIIEKQGLLRGDMWKQLIFLSNIAIIFVPRLPTR